jgi:hypothetical protein
MLSHAGHPACVCCPHVPERDVTEMCGRCSRCRRGEAIEWMALGVARWRRARRSWTCRGSEWFDGTPLPAGHVRSIVPGQWCLEWLADSPPFASGPRLCVACALAVGFPPPPGPAAGAGS